MKVAVPCKNREEAGLIQAAMADPAVRALVLVMGALSSLPTDRARRRVLQHVTDKLDEEGSRTKE